MTHKTDPEELIASQRKLQLRDQVVIKDQNKHFFNWSGTVVNEVDPEAIEVFVRGAGKLKVAERHLLLVDPPF